jgi:hypothetical protein
MKGPRRTFLSALAALPLVPHPATRAVAAPAPPPLAAGGAVAEGLLAAACARYALTPAETVEVRKAIEQVLSAADRVRAHPLANSDEPILTFEARPTSLRGAARR